MTQSTNGLGNLGAKANLTQLSLQAAVTDRLGTLLVDQRQQVGRVVAAARSDGAAGPPIRDMLAVRAQLASTQTAVAVVVRAQLEAVAPVPMRPEAVGLDCRL